VTALVVSFAAFMAWSVIGLAALSLARLDVQELRVALTAPVLGSVVMVSSVFLVSRAGIGLEVAGAITIAALVVAAGVVLWRRRPRIPRGAVPVLLVCAANLVILGWPMFRFGFDWISNANDDMANYVLGATKLLDRGLIAPLDVAGLSHDRDLASALQLLHSSGTRPGSELGLAAVSSAADRPPYAMFMPFILALNLSLTAAVGALAAQASPRRAAAPVAALLFAISPLSAYGVLQQLVAQVWGLGIAAALLALLCVVELHWRPGPRPGHLAVIGLLLVGLLLVYIELATTLVAAYALFVAVLAGRRRLTRSALLRLWLAPLGIAALLLNTYLVAELRFVAHQASHGLQGSEGFLFGYALVPTALPSIIGVRTLDSSTTARFTSAAIVLAAVVLVMLTIWAVRGALRGEIAAAVTLAYLALAVYLRVKSADFGLFKLYMYAQPFAAALAASVLFRVRHRVVVGVVVLAVGALVFAQARTLRVYVQRSEDPTDLPMASANGLLPFARAQLTAADPKLVSFTENPTLAKLEAAAAGQRPLYLTSRNVLGDLLGQAAPSGVYPKSIKSAIDMIAQRDGWTSRTFALHASQRVTNRFQVNVRADTLLGQRRCRFVFPTGSEVPFNRLSLPEGAEPLVARSCRDESPLLAFVQSYLGQSFYLARKYSTISFFQLQPDYFFPGHTLSGFGRYVLFRALHPSPGTRLELSLTTTLRHDGRNRLPPAATVGSSRERLPIVGRGSARVYSAPLVFQEIDGGTYVMVDMGVGGRRTPVARPGLSGLYGSAVPLDPRYLTSYVRDVSLISPAAYRRLRVPMKITRFPRGLANPALEYSGIYEDGWIGNRSYVVLSSRSSSSMLHIRATVLPIASQRLRVYVDGRAVWSRRLTAANLNLRVHVRTSPERRRVELRFSRQVPLQAPDLRPAAARLTSIGFD
jgi:hypothetical protein